LQGGSTAQVALADMFEVKKDDHAELFSKFSVFLKLIEDTERRIVNLDHPNKDKFMKCMGPIKGAFKIPSLNASWSDTLKKISDSDIALLELSSEALDAYRKEALIEQDQLEEIKQDTDSLFNEIVNSDLDKNLKVILLDLLEVIRRAIAEYQIRGAEGLKKAVAESVGRLFIDKDIVLKEKDKSAFQSFWKYLAKLNLIVSSALYAKEIGENVNDFIQNLLH